MKGSKSFYLVIISLLFGGFLMAAGSGQKASAESLNQYNQGEIYANMQYEFSTKFARKYLGKTHQNADFKSGYTSSAESDGQLYSEMVKKFGRKKTNQKLGYHYHTNKWFVKGYREDQKSHQKQHLTSYNILLGTALGIRDALNGRSPRMKYGFDWLHYRYHHFYKAAHKLYIDKHAWRKYKAYQLAYSFV